MSNRPGSRQLEGVLSFSDKLKRVASTDNCARDARDCRLIAMQSPSYLRLLESGELDARVEELMGMLRVCRICPRDCDVDRLQNHVAACYSGLLPIVSTYTPHF